MRFVSFSAGEIDSWGLVTAEGIRSLGELERVGRHGLRETIRSQGLSKVLEEQSSAPLRQLTEVTLHTPIVDPEKVICVGLNYADHIAEMGRPTPEYPVIFTRFSDSFVAHGSPLTAPRNSSQFDYEGELAVVIGKTAHHVTAQSAMEHVFGYTILNDGSIRDYQRHTHQFAPGKNFPKSGSFGPEIVTSEEFGAITNQSIRTRVNGEVVQDSDLSQLVFGVAELIAYCSEWTILQPGDIIATGTPGGVGDSRDPKLWLFPGDVVEVEIEGIGTLLNQVADER
ncbi:MAG: fumarylacetoacetate hydrolase family protein [Aquiluna sp.]